MNDLTTLFLIALAMSSGIEFWLTSRQVNHVKANRETVPSAFSTTITPEAHQKAADYTVSKSRLGNTDRVISIIVLLAFTLGGGISALQSVWDSFDLSAMVTGIGLILSVMLLMQLVELPLTLYQTFVTEEQFGFNRNTPVQFAKDFLIQMVLGLALGIPLLALILWVMESVGSYWWLLAWAIIMGFSTLMSWAFPTFIAPLFNKFTPLPDATLKERIEALLTRCGFKSEGIYVMDGSKRSGHGNAYFTGIGDSKRIVFFDTLVDSLEHDELEAVLAHELGHFKRRHVIKMLITSATVSLAGFAILGWGSQVAIPTLLRFCCS
jgi:STE24 endopeptidase